MTALATMILSAPMLAQCSNWTPDHRGLRLNEIQVLGSHNSYKKAIDDVVMTQLQADNPATASGLDYAHLPLDKQLSLGLRKLELDIFYDPVGGRYAAPLGATLPGASVYDPGGVMSLPGFKTLHVQDIDFRSHCLRFVTCLEQVVTWSDTHPGHLPLFIMINAKDDVIDRPGFVRPLTFDAAAWDALDLEIRSNLATKLVTPDDIRGDSPTLREAALAGWPSIDSLTGKVLVVLDDSAAKKKAYARDHPSLAGRAMFVDAPENTDEAGIRIVNDPLEHESYIRELVEQGFIVRTRADADTREARSGSYARYEAALRSGAQIISTDYYVPATRFETNFHVVLPGRHVARCNPVLIADEACTVTEP